MQKGLTTKEAEAKLKEHGLNQIQERKKKNIFNKFIEQISSFLMILLIAAAIISFFIGEVLDGSLILTIIILNAAFGVYQEFKAEEAVAALKKMTISKIRVIRNGKEQEIDSKYLVPGDIIMVEEGVKLPADAEILETIHLEINEAALTGESIPVVKAKGESLFMGTIVAKGRGVARVTQTAMATKFGQIAEKLSSLEETKTPLQSKLAHITEIIGLVGILLSFAVFALSSLQGNGYFPSFLLATSLAVAVVPESLPAVMTIILSIGVKHMAARKAIMRKLGAIEALGSITLIATDKTGTLTTNEMEVKEVWFDEKVHEAEDLYNKYTSDSKKIEIPHTLKLLVKNGILCSTATLVSVADGKDDGAYDVLGDPTEGALLKLAHNLNTDPEAMRKHWHLIDELPFDSIKKRMSVITQDGDTFTFSKGAPESILDICTKILIDGKEHKLTEEYSDAVQETLKKWAAEGLRVLAFSYNKCKSEKNCKVEEENVFIGMTAIHDPPRKEAQVALEKAKSAGIHVVMITGDNEKTAEAIGSSIGLLQKGEAILRGEQIESYTDEELLDVLPRTRIFARVTPFHKSRIVSLYQKLDEVVAVTGDGVNDAIALKQADVGVAMGKIGTDVARETADMVITDDNFATIVNAVEEGRNIVMRLKSSIRYLLAGNLAEGLSILVTLSFGFPPIFVPIQLLYINLISDGVPALALAFTPSDERVMKDKPSENKDLLPKWSIEYILSVGTTVAAIVVVVFYFAFTSGGEIVGRTAAFSVMATIQTFIFIDIWFSHKSPKHSYKAFFSRLFILTVAFPIIALFFIVRVPFIAELFHIETISNLAFFEFIGISALALLGIQGVKRLLRK